MHPDGTKTTFEDTKEQRLAFYEEPASALHTGGAFTQPAAVKEAMLDVITQHLNGQLTTEAALKRLPEAVAAAK